MADRRGGEYLQGVVAKTRETGLVNWPQLTKNDYKLFREFIEVYSFIDFNLRRFMEVLDFRPRRAACAANRSKTSLRPRLGLWETALRRPTIGRGRPWRICATKVRFLCMKMRFSLSVATFVGN